MAVGQYLLFVPYLLQLSTYFVLPISQDDKKQRYAFSLTDEDADHTVYKDIEKKKYMAGVVLYPLKGQTRRDI